MAYAPITVNETGVKEIQQFFADFHPRGSAHLTRSVLEDLVLEVENTFSETGQASLELKPWDCTLGRAKELVLHAEGWDFDDAQPAR